MVSGATIEQEIEHTGHSYKHIAHNQSNKPYLMLAELVDNSIDAGADEINIIIQRSRTNGAEHELLVSDNGSGMSDFKRFFTLGEHVEDLTRRRIGCYGSGAKVACIWLTHDDKVRGSINILSTCGGHHYAAHQNIGTIIHDGLKTTFTVTPVDEDPADLKKASGTLIKLTGGERLRRLLANRSQVVKDLFNLYEMPITEGRLQIKVNGEPVTGKPTVFEGDSIRFDEAIFYENSFYHLSFECGEVSSDFNGLSTWNIYHAGRCINYREPESFGESLAPKFCGKVILKEITDSNGEELYQRKWPLSFNKDYLEEWMREKISEIIYGNDEVVALIDRLKKAKQTESFKTLQENANTILEGISGNAKAMRPGDLGLEGTKIPTGNGGHHKDARFKKPSQNGRMRLGGRARGGSIRVEFLHLGTDQPSFLVDSRSKTIQVNMAIDGMANLFAKNYDVGVVRDLVNRWTAVWATMAWAGFNATDASFDKAFIDERQTRAATDLTMIALQSTKTN